MIFFIYVKSSAFEGKAEEEVEDRGALVHNGGFEAAKTNWTEGITKT